MAKNIKLLALRAKIADLQKQAKEIEGQNHRGIAEAVELIRKFKLTLTDWKQAWALTRKSAPKISKVRKHKKVAVKYADDKGNKWTGRGRTPLWLVAAQKSGKKRDDYLVKAKQANGTAIH